MLIWSSTGKEIVQDRGDFYCPRCESTEDYKEVRVARYFTLYFIPLFETSTVGEYVECLHCGQKYNVEVLNYEPPSKGDRVLASIRKDLESGTPIQMARTKLTNSGVSEEAAERLVSDASGGGLRECRTCNLNFVRSVKRCSACARSL